MSDILTVVKSENFHSIESYSCGNKMHPIIQNMTVSQGLELILSMFRRTTMSGQHPLI